LETSLSKKGQTNDSYSFFRKRIMFPIFDTMQNIVGFGARSIDPNDQPKYLNSSDHKAYDKSSLLY
jgi:DNA primase